MRQKLHAFQAFADTLLPLETDYLLRIQRFEDAERVGILHQLAAYTRQPVAFDEQIDKRKYSYVKKWVQEHLEAIDVDKQLAWLMRTEMAIFTDSIHPKDEKDLLRQLEQTGPAGFHFQKLYEIARLFRHYLLIRMRYKSVQTVEIFLKTNQTAYARAVAVSDELYRLTRDLSGRPDPEESRAWAEWLDRMFYDETLDGHNRILAFVRLIYWAYRFRMYAMLPDKLDYLERAFGEGRLYSRRILTNYYSQRLLFHAQAQEFEKAAVYGHWSLRNANTDRLYYANNLAGVLLRLRRGDEALRVLRGMAAEAKRSVSFHNKIGHAAYTIGAYNLLGRYPQAVTHAEVMLRAYKKEIFDHRWHLFFTNYWEALLCSGQTTRLIKASPTAQVLERDQEAAGQPNYLPTLPWLWSLAAYLEGQKEKTETLQTLQRWRSVYARPHLPAALQHLQELTLRLAPELIPG